MMLVALSSAMPAVVKPARAAEPRAPMSSEVRARTCAEDSAASWSVENVLKSVVDKAAMAAVDNVLICAGVSTDDVVTAFLSYQAVAHTPPVVAVQHERDVLSQ